MPDSTSSTGAREGDRLTEREREILALVAAGLSTERIAQQLAIKPSTIKTHLTSIFRKTGTANRVQAARHHLDNLRKDEQRSPRAPRGRARLSRRELEVLEHIGAGATSETIARELGLMQTTIKSHLAHIYKKTGSQNRVQAARYYLRHYAADTAQLTNLDDEIADIKVRIHELQPAVDEAQRLQQALEKLQAARRALES